MSEPIASRKNKYWPPAFGNIAASSPYARAPSSVMTPVTIQTTSNQKGEPTDLAMSAETMKMPDPIMAPATSIVASTSVSALTNSCGVSVVAGRSATTVVMQLLNLDEQTFRLAGKAGGASRAPRAGPQAPKVTAAGS